MRKSFSLVASTYSVALRVPPASTSTAKVVSAPGRRLTVTGTLIVEAKAPFSVPLTAWAVTASAPAPKATLAPSRSLAAMVTVAADSPEATDQPATLVDSVTVNDSASSTKVSSVIGIVSVPRVSPSATVNSAVVVPVSAADAEPE